MFETARYEAERRLTGSVVLAAVLSAFAAMMILLAPGLLAEIDMAAYAEQLPPQMVAAFDLEVMGSIEGFIAIELYEFVWLLGLGVYVAYQAAGDIAGDVEDGQMDMLLSTAVSREQVVAEKFLAVLTPIIVVNVVVLTVVSAGTRLVGEPVPAADLVAVHALSVPYLLCCAALGVFASVAAPSRRTAEGTAAVVVVGTFLIEGVTAGTDLAWMAAIAPMNYYDTVAVLTESEYDLVGAGVLLAATAVLLVASQQWFARRDVR